MGAEGEGPQVDGRPAAGPGGVGADDDAAAAEPVRHRTQGRGRGTEVHDGEPALAVVALAQPGEDVRRGVEEALRAASSIGDDRLQRQARGYVTPESFTHGTSAQRVRWFRRGLEEGSLAGCDTFASGGL